MIDDRYYYSRTRRLLGPLAVLYGLSFTVIIPYFVTQLGARGILLVHPWRFRALVVLGVFLLLYGIGPTVRPYRERVPPPRLPPRPLE